MMPWRTVLASRPQLRSMSSILVVVYVNLCLLTTDKKKSLTSEIYIYIAMMIRNFIIYWVHDNLEVYVIT